MRRALLILAAVSLVVTIAGVGVALGSMPDNHGDHHGGRRLSATLRGINETPFAGDPDGSGTVSLTLNPGHRRICFSMHVTGITLPATAANVYRGAAGVAGTVVASLVAPTTTGSS